MFQLLDCTLRDGGYYTNWDFDPNLVEHYLRAVASLPIRYCEVGYRAPAREKYFGEYYYLRRSTLERLRSWAPDGPEFAVMLDAKNCTAEGVPALMKGARDIISLVRLALDPGNLDHGMKLVRALKECGFKVTVNLMYLHTLCGECLPFLEKIKKFEVLPDILYLVDSYGACFPDDVGSVVAAFKKSLDVPLGFHSHDNLCLAFANTLKAIESGVEYVDATMLGLGRGAGNLATEVIAVYYRKMSQWNGSLFHLASFLEELKRYTAQFEFGQELPYIVSGMLALPQKDVMRLMGKRRYSISQITRMLGKEHAAPPAGDTKEPPAFKLEGTNPKCMVIGGGSTAMRHAHAVMKLAEKLDAAIVHSSTRHIGSYIQSGKRQYVCLSGDEAMKLSESEIDALLAGRWTFIVSNQPRIGELPERLKSSTASIYCADPLSRDLRPIVRDTPLGLALGAAASASAPTVMLAGFDGYDQPGPVENDLAKETQDLLNLFRQMYADASLFSITETKYDIDSKSLYTL